MRVKGVHKDYFSNFRNVDYGWWRLDPFSKEAAVQGVQVVAILYQMSSHLLESELLTCKKAFPPGPEDLSNLHRLALPSTLLHKGKRN